MKQEQFRNWVSPVRLEAVPGQSAGNKAMVSVTEVFYRCSKTLDETCSVNLAAGCVCPPSEPDRKGAIFLSVLADKIITGFL